MAPTVADFLLERLRAWDVRHVFGYPGDGINGILAAWGRADNQPQFIQARHEEMAAFEAVGYAKFTGRVGVCAATSRPGAIHLLNGLYDPEPDHLPVCAIRGPTYRSAMAAEAHNAGMRLACLAGQGVRGAGRELEEMAELLGAGVAKPLLGKDVLSDELPYVTGAIGLLGTRPSYELMMNCDTLLTVGSNFPYTQFLPDFGQARGGQIDIDGKFIGMRYPYEVNLVGDAAATLPALIPHLHPH